MAGWARGVCWAGGSWMLYAPCDHAITPTQALTTAQSAMSAITGGRKKNRHAEE